MSEPEPTLADLAHDAVSTTEKVIECLMDNTRGPTEALAVLMITTKAISIVAHTAGYDIEGMKDASLMISNAEEVKAQLDRLATIVGTRTLANRAGSN